MYAFSVSTDLTIDSRHGHRRLPAALPQDAAGGLNPARVFLAIHDEDGLVRETLKAKAGIEGTPDRQPPLRLYGEEDLQLWPGWPTRLGRLTVSADAGPTTLDDPAPLRAQLVDLRVRHRAKRHFRIAMVGGFGFNLGDTLIGATAFRSLLPVLQNTLPSVSADVLLGPAAHQAIPELIGHEDGIGEIFFHGPSLQDFARYDAFFDFTGLVTLPRFHAMPAIDWVLWWLGLDPDVVSAASKRNQLRLPKRDMEWAQAKLAACSSPRIAFVWRASTPLRSMPDDTAVRFARALLVADATLTLVTDRPLALDNPRLLDLGREADTAERMMALVASADGLISVDSLAPHVADAAGVPCVMLLASLPKSRFPYYPHTDIVTPPGMEHLLGWGVTKVSAEAWAGMSEAYQRAWDTVSAEACLAILAERVADARSKHRVETGAPWNRAASHALSVETVFPHDVPNPLGRWIDAEMARFAETVLQPGHTAVLASGDNEGLAAEIARLVAPSGALHVLEPRRLRAQKLVADIAVRGFATLHLWPAMAGAMAGKRDIPDFDSAGEADPAAFGNVLRPVTTSMIAIDDLRLADCRLVLLRPPQDILAALAGAQNLLYFTKPLLIAGPVPAACLNPLHQMLAPLSYECLLCWPERAAPTAALFLAAPVEAQVRFEGFEKL